MDFLRSVFEEQLELQVDTSGNAVIGDTVFSPVTILRADSAAYEDEFSKWLSERWLPEQKEVLEQILVVHANRKRFTDLCSTLQNGQLVPLVGSGMSVPSGFTVWPDFLRSIRLHSSMNEKDLEELLARWEYEEAAEQLAAAMPGRLFDERIEHELRIDDPVVICGAVVFLPELFDKLVLTTNLDDLLEKMYDQRGQRFSHILSGHAIGEFRKAKANSERLLLKFHGDCRSRDGRVLGKREYDAAYANGSPVSDELTTIYRTHSILSLGCSLNPDRTVALLAEVAKMDQGMPRHYAFLQHPKDADVLRQREHFLTDRDVFPIWYPGDHDESIQALLVGMMLHVGRL
jgi:SIR2-like domain